MPELPLAPIKRVIKNAGAERVSDDAVEAMRDVLEREAEEIAGEAQKFADHAGRKTVKREDIEATQG